MGVNEGCGRVVEWKGKWRRRVADGWRRWWIECVCDGDKKVGGGGGGGEAGKWQ